MSVVVKKRVGGGMCVCALWSLLFLLRLQLVTQRESFVVDRESSANQRGEISHYKAFQYMQFVTV